MAFLYPSFLWALISLLIPVAIHLFNLRKPKVAYFTNVEFLKEVKLSTINKNKLKHLLILACRVLCLLFLVLAFAQPYLKSTKLTNNEDKSEIAVFIDNSYSTQNNTANKTALLTEAVNAAEALLKQYAKSTSFFLFDYLHFNAADKNTATEAHSRLQTLDYSGRVMTTAAFVSKMNSLQRSEGSIKSYLLSDFQKSTFDKDAFINLDSAARLTLVPIEPTQVQNLYVDTLYIADQFIRQNQTNSVTVLIRNSGTEKASGTVKFLMESTQVGSVNVDIEAKTSTKVQFNFALPDTLTHTCTILLDDAPVTFDNKYYFTIKTSPAVSILHVAPQPNMAVQKAYENEPLFKLRSTSESNINFADLEASNLVVINEAQKLDAGLIDNIKRHIFEGASLLIIPSVSHTQEYLRLLQQLNIQAVEPVSQNETQKVALPDLQNPFYKGVFEKLPRETETPLVKPVLTWRNAPDNLLLLKSGRPMLSRFKAGKGSVYLMASPLTEPNSTFLANALLVPVLYKIAVQSQKTSGKLAYTFNDRNITLPVRTIAEQEQVYSLKKDSVEWIPEQRLIGNTVVFSLPADLSEAGFYTLRHNNTTLAQLAVNYTKQESEMDFYSPQELQDQVANFKNIDVLTDGTSEGVANKLRQQKEGTSYWKYLLVLAMLALAAETAVIRFVK